MLAGRQTTMAGTTEFDDQAPVTVPWLGMEVRAHDGIVLGRVVGRFESGPCAGRLRVHGDAAQFQRHAATGTAVFAIPVRAVAGRRHGALVLDTTANAARHRWLMHFVEP